MHAGAAPVLKGTDIEKSYGDWRALRGVSLQVSPGEMIACIGPNGAGKTTLLSILAGIQKPSAGDVQGPADEHEIGWVPQQPAVYRKLTVAENLRLFAKLEHVVDVEATVERMLDQTGLVARADERVGHLSGGNQQRLNIAIGVLSSPALLLLDEPTSSLDPRQRQRLWEYVQRLSDGGTAVIYSTHVVSEAERYADRVLVIADGERLFWGTPAELEQQTAELQAGNGGSAEFTDFEAAFVAFLHARGH